MLLPPVSGLEEYREFRGGGGSMPAALEICRRHSLDSTGIERASSGTHLVFLMPGRVIKIYCPLWLEDHRSEKEALESLRGVPVPELLGGGEIDGWPYLMMTLIEGVPLHAVWSGLDGQQKSLLLEDLGRLMRSLHMNKPPEPLSTDWDGFIAKRLEELDTHHRLAPGHWRDWVHHRTDGFCEGPFDQSLLHADITDEHVFLARNGSAWRITGLIDFGDALGGHPFYELAAPLLFLCFGDPSLTPRLLSGMETNLDRETAGRMLAYCLLHQFGRLGDSLARFPVANGVEFEEALFGFRLD